MEPIKSLLVLSFLTMVTLSMCHPTATNGRFYRNDDAIMDYDGYQLIRIKPMNMEQITILKQLENEYEVLSIHCFNYYYHFHHSNRWIIGIQSLIMYMINNQ